MGPLVGCTEGAAVGVLVGACDGPTVGCDDGPADGPGVGLTEGNPLGGFDGCAVGLGVVGDAVGVSVTVFVGGAVGTGVGSISPETPVRNREDGAQHFLLRAYLVELQME